MKLVIIGFINNMVTEEQISNRPIELKMYIICKNELIRYLNYEFKYPIEDIKEFFNKISKDPFISFYTGNIYSDDKKYQDIANTISELYQDEIEINLI